MKLTVIGTLQYGGKLDVRSDSSRQYHMDNSKDGLANF